MFAASDTMASCSIDWLLTYWDVMFKHGTTYAQWFKLGRHLKTEWCIEIVKKRFSYIFFKIVISIKLKTHEQERVGAVIFKSTL